jgi:hypothetical protein
MGGYATAGAGGALDGSAGSNEGELVRTNIAGEESWYGPLWLPYNLNRYLQSSNCFGGKIKSDVDSDWLTGLG